MDRSNLKNAEVAIIQRSSPQEAILEGIKKLGGISEFISIDDQVFILINLRLPNGFPVNTNFDIVGTLIELCKEGGAKKIYVGGFPNKEIETITLSNMLDLDQYFKSIGAELAYLDDQDKFPLSSFEIGNKKFEIPEIILNSDKVISINQISVDPLFKCTLSLLNSYSMVPKRFQAIQKVMRPGKDYLLFDQYKKDLVSNVLDVFCIKIPNLVINDLFYFLEGAGPYIYKDSEINKTKKVVIGSDAVAVDSITLRLLHLDPAKNDLLFESKLRELGTTDFSKIKIIGKNLEDSSLNVKFCVYKLEDINLQNTTIKSGRFCSGCYAQAYHLLNLMKTHMTKDLKYIIKQNFLIGDKPQDPENHKNIILFGNCAINSTKDRDFRRIIIEKQKDILKGVKKKLKKDKKQAPKRKLKQKLNKEILELFGCPPETDYCVKSIIKYYGKSEVPNLNFYEQLTDTYLNNQKTQKKEDDLII